MWNEFKTFKFRLHGCLRRLRVIFALQAIETLTFLSQNHEESNLNQFSLEHTGDIMRLLALSWSYSSSFRWFGQIVLCSMDVCTSALLFWHPNRKSATVYRVRAYAISQCECPLHYVRNKRRRKNNTQNVRNSIERFSFLVAVICILLANSQWWLTTKTKTKRICCGPNHRCGYCFMCTHRFRLFTL